MCDVFCVFMCESGFVHAEGSGMENVLYYPSAQPQSDGQLGLRRGFGKTLGQLDLSCIANQSLLQVCTTECVVLTNKKTPSKRNCAKVCKCITIRACYTNAVNRHNHSITHVIYKDVLIDFSSSGADLILQIISVLVELVM